MRKYIISTMCIAVAIMFAASCNKIEEKIPSVDDNGQAIIDDGEENVGITLDLGQELRWASPLNTFTYQFLPGKFTVDADGKQVYFSRGNLQATHHSSTNGYSWDFAANQYDIVGDASGHILRNRHIIKQR